MIGLYIIFGELAIAAALFIVWDLSREESNGGSYFPPPNQLLPPPPETK